MTSVETIAPLTFTSVSKCYGSVVAVDRVTLEIPAGHVVGLLGRNGAGKTTLLQLATGLLLPTRGDCHTLGARSDLLDSPQLTRLGFVQQEGRFVEWMTVAQHLDFTASFYPDWDPALQARLIEMLELPLDKKLAHLSTGDRQKAGIVLGVCHRPQLLLLDEPMSSLDPIARSRMLDLILERLRDDGCTIVISSHILNDVEKIVDWVVVLETGRVVENAAFDSLQESFAEWTLTAGERPLPAEFDVAGVLAHSGGERLARLVVRNDDPEAGARLAATTGAQLSVRRLSLDEMFPLMIARRKEAS